MVSHQPATFGSEDIKILGCYMISQDYLIKGSCDFMDRSPLRWINILSSLVTICTVVVKL